MKKSMKKSIKIIIIITPIIILLIALVTARHSRPQQIDDVTPAHLCEKNLLEKSDILMVIPIFENQSIADNPEWCRYILSLNKTLGMHGVYHTRREFEITRDKEYVQRGMEEFKKCFGFYPSLFEAPQLFLSGENKKLLESMNLTILSSLSYLTHKVYHCIDYGKSFWLTKLNQLNKIL